MNLAFVGYKELRRSQRVLSTSTPSSIGLIHREAELHNSSYPTQPHSLIAKYNHYTVKIYRPHTLT